MPVIHCRHGPSWLGWAGMFQDFSDTDQRHLTPARIADLRDRFEALWASTGWLCRVPMSFRVNTCPACAERLNWLTGFSGSAGSAVILKSAPPPSLSTGATRLQVREQIDLDLITPLQVPERVSPRLGAARTCLQRAENSVSIRGCSPSRMQSDTMRHAKRPAPTWSHWTANPVDAVWHRPPRALLPSLIVQQPLQFAGVSSRRQIACNCRRA